MRQFSLMIALLMAAVFFYGCAKTVATVNGEPVTQSQLDLELERAGGKNMLETLIGRKLVEEDAAAKHITVSDKEVDDQFNQLKKNFSPTDQQSFVGDKLKMIRDEIRFNLLLKKSILAKVSESEERAYFDKNKNILPEVELSVIVVGNPMQANAIVQELQGEKDFAAAATQYSLDPAGRERGGYVGYQARGNLEQTSHALAQAAFSLDPGGVSPPIKTQKGYYILKVLNKKTTYDELKDEVGRQMASSRAKGYLDDLREKAKIDYKGEYAKK